MSIKSKISYKLRVKLFLLVFALSIIPIILTCLLTFNIWKEDLTHSIFRGTEIISQSLSNKITHTFDGIIHKIRLWSLSNPMNEILFADKELILTNFIIDKKNAFSDTIEEIFCFDMAGKLISATHPKYLKSNTSSLIKAGSLPSKGIQINWNIKHYDIIDKDSLLLKLPIRPFDKTTQIGVMFVFVKFDIFDNLLKESVDIQEKYLRLTHSIMIDKNGYIIGAPKNYRRSFLFDKTISSLGFHLKEALQKSSKGHFFYTNDLLKKNFLIGFSDIQINDIHSSWRVLTFVYKDIAYYRLIKVFKLNSFIIFITILLIMAGSIGAIRRITFPIKDLIVSMSEISDKGLSSQSGQLKFLEIKSDDELGLMAKSYNKMIASLKEKDKGLLEKADELEKINAALSDLTKNLDDKVQKRTEELARSNEQLTKSQTELIALSDKLKETNKNLMQAVALKSEFISNVSHEFRTPLNAIINFSLQILEDWDEVKTDDDWFQEAKKMLMLLEENGQHLLFLVNDILDFEKLEAGKEVLDLQKNDLDANISETLFSVLSLVNAKGLSVDRDVSRKILPFYFDNRKIKQVLINLLSNAIKFTDKGEITVKAKLVHNNTKVAVSVCDPGMGIQEKNLEIIFERFRQTGEDSSKPGIGTGIGLSLCKKYVDLHNGEISVESEHGSGTTITFTLPYITEGPKNGKN